MVMNKRIVVLYFKGPPTHPKPNLALSNTNPIPTNSGPSQ